MMLNCFDLILFILKSKMLIFHLSFFHHSGSNILDDQPQSGVQKGEVAIVSQVLSILVSMPMGVAKLIVLQAILLSSTFKQQWNSAPVPSLVVWTPSIASQIAPKETPVFRANLSTFFILASRFVPLEPDTKA